MQVFGLSATTGILAIALPYAGICAKVYSEIIEEADLAAVRVLPEGTGAISAFAYGRLPDVATAFRHYTLYRFECAMRSTLVLGFIGLPTMGFLPGICFPAGPLRRGRGPPPRFLCPDRLAPPVDAAFDTTCSPRPERPRSSENDRNDELARQPGTVRDSRHRPEPAPVGRYPRSRNLEPARALVPAGPHATDSARRVPDPGAGAGRACGHRARRTHPIPSGLAPVRRTDRPALRARPPGDRSLDAGIHARLRAAAAARPLDAAGDPGADDPQCRHRRLPDGAPRRRSALSGRRADRPEPLRPTRPCRGSMGSSSPICSTAGS